MSARQALSTSAAQSLHLHISLPCRQPSRLPSTRRGGSGQITDGRYALSAQANIHLILSTGCKQ